jgi:predicted nucleic acid-binding protein
MSGFLLDTNIPSELFRLRPNPQIASWLERQNRSALFLSVVTLGDVRQGAAILPRHDPRRDRLEQWIATSLVPWFEGRILPVTHAIADRWGALEAVRQLMGRPLNTGDGMIAATALEHELILTRNVRDFDGLEVTTFNRWES